MHAGLKRSTFFCGEHSGLKYALQRFCSSMSFCNESVFTEISLKRIKGKWRGKDCFHPCGWGLSCIYSGWWLFLFVMGCYPERHSMHVIDTLFTELCLLSSPNKQHTVPCFVSVCIPASESLASHFKFQV